ncbi:hypothetical protein [Ehrlichia chaffeensis]|nr:hypothetical protein [Ehrlichia chaffeensis]
MNTDYDFCQVDFLIQQNGHSNIDVYHGKLHINAQGDEYYASGDIANDVTGDKGVINIINHGTNGVYGDVYCGKCDLQITLEHHDPATDIKNVTSINKTFLISILSGFDACLLVDEHNLLLTDPSKGAGVNDEPVVSILLHNGTDANMIRDSFNKDYKIFQDEGKTYKYVYVDQERMASIEK